MKLTKSSPPTPSMLTSPPSASTRAKYGQSRTKSRQMSPSSHLAAPISPTLSLPLTRPALQRRPMRSLSSCTPIVCPQPHMKASCILFPESNPKKRLSRPTSANYTRCSYSNASYEDCQIKLIPPSSQEELTPRHYIT